MGGAFSCGKDNDDLINILKLHGYISSKNVEKVFRAVDRGDYILASHRELAYKDMSCKVGNIHLSAPCVYCKVMEGLSLQPGLSFLNIGSGTGYLSTMAGLILGENGTNHGIEMHEDCVTYAYQHLEEFKQKSLDVDVFEFCEPVFQVGNFLNAMPNRQYDRVYCGAACPEAHEKFVKQFVKIGGILVMPYKDHLRKVRRTGPTTWNNSTMLPVSFALLMTPQEEADRCLLQLPLCKPHTLQELCRSSIRRRLRKNVWFEHNDLEEQILIKTLPVNHPLSGSRSGFGIPLIDRNPGSGEIITSTLELLMESSLQAVLNGGAREIDTSDESEDNDEFEINRLLIHPANGDHRITVEHPEIIEDVAHEDTSATINETMNETQEKSVSMEIGTVENRENTKETPDIEMRESKECEQGGSQFARSSGSSMKRKNPERETDDSANESEQNIRPQERNGHNVGENSYDMSDSDDEDNLDFILFKQVYSMLKVKSQMNENTSSENDNNEDEYMEDEDIENLDIKSKNNEEKDNEDEPGEKSPIRSTSRNSEALRDEETSKVQLSHEIEVDESLFSRKLDSSIEQQRGSRKRERSSESKSDDQRPETKVSNADVKSPRSADMNDDKTLDESCHMSDDDDDDDDNNDDEDDSDENSSDTSSESGWDDSSVSNQLNDSLHDEESDATVEYNSGSLFGRRKITRKIFAHTIRKDLFSGFMRKKIDQLPLPRPLRLYVNYNREL